MELSVSLSEQDIETLDAYVECTGLGSRSAALQHAVRHLRLSDLEADYAAAWSEWSEWSEPGDQEAWASVAADGLGTDAAR